MTGLRGSVKKTCVFNTYTLTLTQRVRTASETGLNCETFKDVPASTNRLANSSVLWLLCHRVAWLAITKSHKAQAFLVLLFSSECSSLKKGCSNERSAIL